MEVYRAFGCIGSQIELNRPMKGVSARRVNHAELKLPPWAKVWWLGGRIFWPKAGILVRLRSLWVTIPVRSDAPFFRNPSAVRQNTGISPRFARPVLDIAPEGGLG